MKTRRNKTIQIQNQGTAGTCVGFSGAVVFADTPGFQGSNPSPWWIYKQAQKSDEWAGEDYAGTSIRGALKAMEKLGVASWDLYSAEDTMRVDASQDAGSKKIAGWQVVDIGNKDEIERILETRSLWVSMHIGNGFKSGHGNIGAGVFHKEENFIDPDKSRNHAMALIGYRDIEGKRYYEFQNSWGDLWGSHGYCWIREDTLKSIVNYGAFYILTKDEVKKDKKSFIVRSWPYFVVGIISGATIVKILLNR